MRMSRIVSLLMVVAAILVATTIFDASIIKSTIAVLIVAVLVKLGWVMIGGLAAPIPDPAEAGQLRKVKLLYRCSVCGAEVKMTVAASEDPEPPRHHLEDMDLVAPTIE